MSIEPGRTVAHYRLVEKLGEGGMGVVWKALDTNLDREVAIKFLPHEFSADPDRLVRFEREAKLLASMSHPNIATVYGLHEQDGTRFLAMELIPGEDLAHKLDDRALPLAQALDAARQVASALEATHERGVIHRDLKPANIYVTPDGQVKVLDFGIARDIEAEEPEDGPSATQPGSIVGTVEYMSPEQARGKTLDERTDLWSFGCVLYRMLCGRPAFEGETRWDRLVAVLRQQPDWEAVPATTPQPVADLLRRCLEKEPEKRLADAGEARRVLEKELAGFSTDDLLALDDGGKATKKRRGPGVWIAAAVVIVAAVVAVWQLREPAPSEPAGMRDEDDRSIAVLPFESAGGGDENAMFTAGIHDDILNRLAKIGALDVISRTSVMEYAETTKNLKQIGAELGVGTILEGSVQRAAQKVRTRVQLIDVASGQSLWAETYTNEISMESILETQSDIAEQIAAALHATLSANELARISTLPTRDLEALEAYNIGRKLYLQPGNEADKLIRARDMFQLAVNRDPNFAKAYAEMSLASRTLFWMGGGTDEDLEAAFEAAMRSLELDPDLPEGHFALGTYYYSLRQYDRALGELHKAEEGMGTSQIKRAKGYLLRRRSEWQSALDDLMEARELAPRDSEATNEVGFTLMCLRNYEEADRYFVDALELSGDSYPSAQIYRAMLPALQDGKRESAAAAIASIESAGDVPWKFPHGWQFMLYAGDYDRALAFVGERGFFTGQSHKYPAKLLKGWTLRLQGRDQQADAELEQALRLLGAENESSPPHRERMAFALIYALLGRKEQALDEGRRAAALMPIEKDAVVGAWLVQDLAWVYLLTGELDQAVEAFDQLLSVPSLWSIELLQLDPRIEPLRDHPGFRTLVDKHARVS